MATKLTLMLSTFLEMALLSEQDQMIPLHNCTTFVLRPASIFFDTSRCCVASHLWEYRSASFLLVPNSLLYSITLSLPFWLRSGRLLFSGYDDYHLMAWDTVLPQSEKEGNNAWKLVAHENRVSCLGVPSSGQVLCTGSWDNLLKVWA